MGVVCVMGLYLVLSPLLKNGDVGETTHHGQSGVVLPVVRHQLSNWVSLWPNESSAPLSLSRPVTSLNMQPSGSKRGHIEVNGTLRVSSRVLLLYDDGSNSVAKEIGILLQSHRIPFDAHPYNEDVTVRLVTSQSDGLMGKYCLIICADVASLYGAWSETHRQHYLYYASTFNITMIHLAPSGGQIYARELSFFSPWSVHSGDVYGVMLNVSRPFYYLKTGEWFTDIRENDSWTAFIFADSAPVDVEILACIKLSHNMSHDLALAMVSNGNSWRGVREVFIGSPISFWMTKLLLLDVMRSYSTHSLARFGRKRWVMIDIDDIFVAPKGLKMNSGDVEVSGRVGGIEEGEGDREGGRGGRGFRCEHKYSVSLSA